MVCSTMHRCNTGTGTNEVTSIGQNDKASRQGGIRPLHTNGGHWQGGGQGPGGRIGRITQNSTDAPCYSTIWLNVCLGYSAIRLFENS